LVEQAEQVATLGQVFLGFLAAAAVVSLQLVARVVMACIVAAVAVRGVVVKQQVMAEAETLALMLVVLVALVPLVAQVVVLVS
jgi:hypothetical protein